MNWKAKEFNITHDRLLKTLTLVCGHQSVSSALPETTYEALQKYGRDLVQEARTANIF